MGKEFFSSIRNIVDLGAGNNGMLCHLCEALGNRLNPNAKVVGVDYDDIQYFKTSTSGVQAQFVGGTDMFDYLDSLPSFSVDWIMSNATEFMFEQQSNNSIESIYRQICIRKLREALRSVVRPGGLVQMHTGSTKLFPDDDPDFESFSIGYRRKPLLIPVSAKI